MQTVLVVASVVALWAVVFALVGAPMLLNEWRKRRESVLACRIALTDALDGELGPFVTPLVKSCPKETPAILSPPPDSAVIS